MTITANNSRRCTRVIDGQTFDGVGGASELERVSIIKGLLAASIVFLLASLMR